MSAPSRLRRRLRWAALLLAPVAGCGAFNLWSSSGLEEAYRRALESHLQANPSDPDGWYALATCAAVADEGPHGFTARPEFLAKANALERRPLFVLTELANVTWRPAPEKEAARVRLRAAAGEQAVLWLALAEIQLSDGRHDEALEAIRRALACPRMGYRHGEAIDLHRRFLRRFLGAGYAADTLIVRHLPVDHLVYIGHRSFDAVEAEAGRLWRAGDKGGARTLLASLYRLGEDSRSKDMKWRAALLLCALALEARAADAESWKDRANRERPRDVNSCGNVYYNDDPWIVNSTWPGHNPYTFLVPGTWVPLWYRLQKSRFHAIAEGVGDPTFPAWRRADREVAGRPGSPSHADIVWEYRDLLTRPGESKDVGDSLLILATAPYPALMTPFRPQETLTFADSSPNSAALAYLQARRGAFEGADKQVRGRIATILAGAHAPFWKMDAWRLSAQLDRDTYVDATLSMLGGDPDRLALLREVTGQTFGPNPAEWQMWRLRETRAQGK